MKKIVYWLKWIVGILPGTLHCWWEGLDFYVKWSDSVTGEVYRLYKCSCKIIELPEDNYEDYSDDGWDL